MLGKDAPRRVFTFGLVWGSLRDRHTKPYISPFCPIAQAAHLR
jgi:hypothetical protein